MDFVEPPFKPGPHILELLLRKRIKCPLPLPRPSQLDKRNESALVPPCFSCRGWGYRCHPRTQEGRWALYRCFLMNDVGRPLSPGWKGKTNVAFVTVPWSSIFSPHSCLTILELYYVKTLLGGLPSGNRKLTTTGALIWLGVAYPQYKHEALVSNCPP